MPYGLLLALSILIPVTTEVVKRLQGDPEAEVSEALKALQESEMRKAQAGLAVESKVSEDLRRQYRYPYEQLARVRSGMESGLFRGADLGEPGLPGGGNREVSLVAERLGIDPRELKSRLDPKRVQGGMSLSQHAFVDAMKKRPQ